MSFLDEIISEEYGVPGEGAAMARGNSDAYYRRQQASKPRMMPSQTAGQWEYVPVDVRSGGFTQWNPNAQRTDMSPGGSVYVRQEDTDPLSEVTGRINFIVDAIFPEQGE